MRKNKVAKEKIAILVDSFTDIPENLRERFGIYVAPLRIIYSGEEEYRDGVDIIASQVYSRFPDEIPSTSQPSPGDVSKLFKRIKADGFTHVISPLISDALSGTFNVISGFGKNPEGLVVEYLDTKSIAIGAGLTGIRAGQLIEEGKGFDEIIEELHGAIEHTYDFFCVETLDYLVKGGRIGKVAGMIGQILDLRPIISCGDDGLYYTAAKARGRKKSLRMTLEKATEHLKGDERCNIAVVHGDAEKEAEELLIELKEILPNHDVVVQGQITPGLVVHSGPGLIGVVVQCIVEP